MHTTPRSAKMRTLGVIAAAAIAAITLAGCTSSNGGSSDAKTTITLAGPNQWNNDSSSFGPAWNKLVSAFEKANPNITVKTDVLPISSFADTLSTELSAGTAPELIFNGAPHQPNQVVSLDKYLAKPNPYDTKSKTWLDSFNSTAFSDAQRNAKGNFEWVPFNLVTTGLFFNETAMKKAGVSTPITSIGKLSQACTALKKAGYTPLAMDGGTLGVGWTWDTMLSNMLEPYASQINWYDAKGNPGKATPISQKSLLRAVLTNKIDATTTPQVAETLKLMKKVFTNCATPNWSGVASSATFVGGQEFLSGKAAMAWGTNFAVGNLDSVKWKWSSMPFPTITKKDTSLASGTQARFGAVAGGTSYMIPATTKGAKLAAAVKFLQFATASETNSAWVKATGSIPATKDTSGASNAIAPLLTGSWSKAPLVSIGDSRPAADQGTDIFDGYLLGTKTLDQETAYIQSEWTAWAKETAKTAGLTDSWATGN